MKGAKLNPTLFDKLVLSDRVAAVLDEGRAEMQDINARAAETRIDLDRYGESAVRASVRRELGWLLNTVRLEAGCDLSRAPEVKTSVLNYGMPDMTGRPSTLGAVQSRAQEIAQAVRTFEPRLDPRKLQVQAQPGVDAANAISFVIHGDVTAAVDALPVRFLASVEVETGEAVVKD